MKKNVVWDKTLSQFREVKYKKPYSYLRIWKFIGVYVSIISTSILIWYLFIRTLM